MSSASLLFLDEVTYSRKWSIFIDKMHLSPSGRLLLIIDGKDNSLAALYNTSAKVLIAANFSRKVVDLDFTVDDSAIIYSVGTGIVRYFLSNRTEQFIVRLSKFNKISDI